MGGTAVGRTCVVLTHGQGTLVVLGYDLSRRGMMPWCERLLAMLNTANSPVHWTGVASVQLIDCGDKVALVNYNTNFVTGPAGD